MKKKFFLIWIVIFAILIAIDAIVYKDAENLDCIEPSIGITLGVNIVLSMITAVIFAMLIDSYSSNKKICWVIFIAQFISLVLIFVWLIYLKIIPIVLVAILFFVIAILEIIVKKMKMAGACFLWIIVLICLMCYIPRIGYAGMFSVTSCSEQNQDSGSVTISQANDKVEIVLYGCTEEQNDEGHAQASTLSFKVKNISDEPVSLDELVIVAYDDKMDTLSVSSDDKGVVLQPGEKSKELTYSIDKPARAAEVIGYRYKSNGEHFFDFFYEPTVVLAEDEEVQ